MRPRFAAALLTLAVVAPAAAHDAAGRAMARLLPEPQPEGEAPPAYYDAAEQAAWQLDAGRYRRALWDAPADATLVRAEALLALGDHDAAAELLGDREELASLLLLARVRADAGDPAAAADVYRRATELDATSLAARAGLGHALEAAGDVEGATDAYRWFEEDQTLRKFFANKDAYTADELADAAGAIDRLATITFQYRDKPDLHDDVLSMLTYAYDTIERGHVDSRVAAARFLYQRSDLAAAIEELSAALAARPTDAAGLTLLAQIHLDRFGFGEAGDVVAKLRAIDPASAEADLLDARSLLLQRQPGRAMPAVERVLAADADNVEALGLLAAIHALRLEFDQSDAVLAQIDAIDPDDAVGHFAVGEQLAARRQYDRAADVLRVVVDRAPYWTAARNELGELLVQAGREAEATAELSVAVGLDPFAAGTANYLGLLGELANYDRLNTEHFIVRHDHEHPLDGLAGELMATWLDGMHEDVSGRYGWEPEQPTDIQIFPTHDRFSVRVAGDPYVGTVGACTGPVIALVAPHDGGQTLGAFDWARVMQHEYVHTITLGATGNRVWHWLTEGLAVRGEDSPPSQQQLDLLAGATLNGELFGVEDLTWGFVRPRKPTDRAQAYAQSWMVTEWIAETHGEEALANVLAASGRGLTEAEALRELFDLSPEAFDETFEAWMQAKVEAWGHDRASTARYAIAVQAGESALSSRDWAAAVEAFEQAREVRPLDEGPIRRLAALYLLTDRMADAAEMLWAVAQRTTTDGRLARRAAEVWLELGENDKALTAAWRAVYGNSYDRQSHEVLLQAAEATGDASLAAAQRDRLERLAAATAE